ncbi:MAG: 3,4-dihydroxy-2-butanone-4-phosphate synthase [Alphaproteobacteria bacterium]|nr:3,4-dihydroxy-2-butanone-4-phosphate synthase [Alphaproteobacteria bacterium]
MDAVPYRSYLSDIEALIEDFRNGRMVILVDDETRENEGDLVIPAQMATPEAINFMAKHARGLICLALTGERVGQLGLPFMAQDNQSPHQTAFTVSIEAREGVTTGISAHDRAHTVAVAIDPTKGKDDVVTPGHVFPLMARDGGVLVRAGHTEAAVDLSRLAGLYPAGVICEIMNDDGTMARMPDLVKFAQFHGLKIGTIADLIAYRRRNDRVVERIAESEFESVHGGAFRLIVYRNLLKYSEHIALVKGDLSAPGPVRVRVHSLNLLDDVLGDASGKAGHLTAAIRQIGKAERGVIVVIREARPTTLSEKVEAKLGRKVEREMDLREYGIGAQILIDLGVREFILLSNTKRGIVGLEGFGLAMVGQEPLEGVGR